VVADVFQPRSSAITTMTFGCTACPAEGSCDGKPAGHGDKGGAAEKDLLDVFTFVLLLLACELYHSAAVPLATGTPHLDSALTPAANGPSHEESAMEGPKRPCGLCTNQSSFEPGVDDLQAAKSLSFSVTTTQSCFSDCRNDLSRGLRAGFRRASASAAPDQAAFRRTGALAGE